METDPKIVARLAAKLEDENWRFCSWVKVFGGPSPARVDALARQFGKAAQKEMDCTTCGACCRDNCIPVSEDEVDRLAARLDMSADEFRDRYVGTDDDHEPAIETMPCPFLEGNICSVYEDRPEACRGYPYVGGNVAGRMMGIIERAETCPIIFEMLEQLKAELGFRRFR